MVILPGQRGSMFAACFEGLGPAIIELVSCDILFCTGPTITGDVLKVKSFSGAFSLAPTSQPRGPIALIALKGQLICFAQFWSIVAVHP